MRHSLSILIIIAGVINASISAGSVVDPLTDANLTIRTYDNAAVPPADRETALAEATAILEAAGIDVEWLACDAVFVRSAAHPCMGPLGATELLVRFVRLPPPAGGGDRVPLGYSLVDTHARSGALATIYVDRVTRVARDAGARADILLGRAIAHEIGHLLLGSKTHARVGLMRAMWPVRAVRRERTGDWLFTAADARTMREAVRSGAVERMAAIVWGN